VGVDEPPPLPPPQAVNVIENTNNMDADFFIFISLLRS
jgi:hypothetical protein